jgi:hypothetical protein
MFGWLLKRLRSQQSSSQATRSLADMPPNQIDFTAVNGPITFAPKEAEVSKDPRLTWSAQELKSEAQRVRQAFINS